jgi:hypothetical protein
MKAAQEIEVLIRAKYPILYIVSWEERRVEEAVAGVCKSLNRTLHTWSITQGMRPPVNRTTGPVKPTTLPGELEALALVHEAAEYTVFLLRDFHPYLKDSRVIRLLRDLALRLRGKAQTLILTGPVLNLPTELEKDVSVVDFGLPNLQEIDATLEKVIAAIKDNKSVDSSLEPLERELLTKSAQGLTLDEIESVFARSLVEKKKFDVDVVLEEKKQIIRKSGLLEYYPAQNSLGDVGGMELLKEWLQKRTKSFTDKAKEFGIPAPKGILLLGVQGCGKSLLAKAVSWTSAGYSDRWSGSRRRTSGARSRWPNRSRPASSGPMSWKRASPACPAAASATPAPPPASSPRSSPGCRRRLRPFSSSRPPTMSRPSRRKCSERAASTRSSSSICPIWRSGSRSSGSTW